MAASPEDADHCQKCEDAPATETVVVKVGGIPAGPLFVCGDCAENGGKNE